MESRYYQLFENIPVGLCRVTPDGKFLEANPALARITGCPDLKTVFAHNVSDFLADGETRGQWLALIEAGQDLRSFEGQGCRRDGTPIWIRFSANGVRDGKGRVQHYEMVVEDITADKTAADEIRHNEMRFHMLARSTKDVIWDWDLVHGTLWRNENFQTLFGYREEEIEPGIESWSERIHPQDKGRVVAGIYEVIERGEQFWTKEYRFRRRDGSYAHIFDRGYVIRDNQGKAVRMVGAMIDFTERQCVEEALHKSQMNLLAAQRIGHIGSWEVDVSRGTLTWSDEVYRIFGRDRATFTPTNEAFYAAVHPADLSMVRQASEEAWRTGRRYAADLRILLPDGSVRFVHEEAEMVLNEHGQAQMMIGTVQDVTELKLTEQALRSSEAHLRAIFDTEPECVKLVAADGTLLQMNATGLAMIEADDASQVIGHKIFGLLTPEHCETFRAFHQSVIRGERGILEFEILGFKGTRRWMETHAAPMAGSNGATVMLGITRDITDRKQAESRLHYLAHYDALTGLPNRTLFYDRLQQAMIDAKRHERLVGVVFLDLDRFKNINDTLGHEKGDLFIKAVAERLIGAIRKGDTVARLGGDEFTFVLADMGHVDDAARVAHKILDVFVQPFTIEGRELYMTASLGITLYPFDDVDIQALLRNADVAMYRAKESGRNSYQFYAAEMTVKATEFLALENDLRHALERHEFYLEYQPVVESRTGRVLSVEALLRWRHQKRGTISPAQFIPLVEETGLIMPIGEWVLRTACAQCRAWQKSGFSALKVAVNLSARQFHQLQLAAVVEKTLHETGLSPSSLELEITESIIMQHADTTVTTLNRLHAMGLRVSIDDFGTGYSSLSYLKRFPIDALKIDQSFVRDIATDPDDSAIAQAIITLAHTLGIRVIAEGVETTEQFEFLRGHGCDAMQGYYFSWPVAAEEIVRMQQAGKRLEFKG